ncbi:MAG: DUF3320 domain-containing protein [Roseiarcus sp.]
MDAFETEETSGSEAEAPRLWSLSASVAPRINVAFHQNAVPSIGEIALTAPVDAVDVAVQIRATPPFLKPTTLRIDALAAGATRKIAPVPVELDLAVLAGLTEAVRAEVNLRLRAGEDEFAALDLPVTLLSPNEWTGLAGAPELIAAFVRPNDPAVDAILRKAAEKLAAAGAPRELDGYRSGNRTRALRVAAAIWAALLDERIVYALPPQSFERDGQKVRSPTDILARKVATCLDTTLLFAASLEQAGLHPLVGFLESHAFCGVWLIDDSFATIQIDEPQILRKRLASNDIALIETTLLTAAAPVKFAQARAKAAEYVSETPEKRFESVIDIRRARQRGVFPLVLGGEPSGGAPTVGVAATANAIDEIETIDEDINLTETGPEPTDRVERWKRKLLDLSLRNKLINFKTSKGAVALAAPDPTGLQNRLASEHQIKILPSPPLLSGSDPRDAELRLRSGGSDIARQHALDALARDEVHAPLAEEEVNDRLLELYRAARLAQEEGGANALHLAIGFVSWTPAQGKGQRQRYRAPLLLVPVRLERRTVRSGFRLAAHDDDARVNPTLLEMLRQDFRLSMPELDRDLPASENGLDIARIWRIAREYLKDMSGFELTEEVVLSTFSFAKYLMWKDLVDRTDLLKKNPVVRHLIDTPQQTYPGTEKPLPDERRLDQEISPRDLFMPLPADSSQTAAVVAAERGHDFVLFGPPGTGKSQTIANMIVQLLAVGKTVLFVSQKTTALEVVRRRLNDVGIGDYCLEVHSAKAQKSEVLAQLKTAWDRRADSLESDWTKSADGLAALRDELNALVSALHRRRLNGMTAHRAMGRVIALRDVAPGLHLAFGDAARHDEAALEGLRDTLKELLVATRAVGSIDDHPLAGVGRREWSPAWRTDLVNAANAFADAAQAYLKARDESAAELGFEPLSVLEATPAWVSVAILAVKPEARHAARWLGEDSRAFRDGFAAWRQRRAACDEIAKRLTGPYREGVFALPLADILREHQQAANALIFLRAGKLRAAAARLAPFAASGAPVDVARDVPALMDLDAARQAARAHDALMSQLGLTWRGLETDPAAVDAQFAWEDAARAAAAQLTQKDSNATSCLAALSRLTRERPNDLGRHGPIVAALTRLVVAYRAADAARARLVELAEPDIDWGLPKGEAWLPTAIARARGWAENERLAPRWCAYQNALHKARAAGLSTLLDRLGTGDVAAERTLDAFEAGYARWWIDQIVESEPALRGFVSDRHEEAVARFRDADQRVADLSRAVVVKRLAERIPPRSAFGTDIEFGVLNAEIIKRRRHMPLRQLFSRMPTALQRIAPCMMMSPLSIAQFLPPDARPYDVVIFDEASQIPVWDAIGAMARGKQVIVAGDPKQLPPTSFFDRSTGDDGDADDIEDLESILDECQSASVPAKELTWHYRSRHESLITFSNERYYDGRLITFPAPETHDKAVRYVNVPGGVYERGGARVNRAEARAVVEEVMRRLSSAGAPDTIGVVTFNSEQQRVIENLLDQARRTNPDIEPSFAATGKEPVFVKNLESVQGDERDVILFSVGYGPDASGRVSQNFGPLNRDGGPRRLNVAITRARKELIVFATLRPEQIDLARTRAAGVRDFKHYLEFAERGARALAAASAPLDRDADSDFEREVRVALEARGWTVHPQVGVSGLRIDLGVVHPEAPGRYLAGVECDGATYHRSATARDRDRLRQSALEDLGWRILRVWSTDWWMDAESALNRLDRQLRAALEDAAQKIAEPQEAQPPEGSEQKVAIADAPTPPLAKSTEDREPAPEESAAPESQPRYAEPVVLVAAEPGEGQNETADKREAPDQANANYRVADLVAEGFRPDREKFYESVYRPTLRRMAARVIEIEGPIFEDCLVSRIAAAHGFGRSGGQIRSTITDVVDRRFPRSVENDGERERTIYWPEGGGGYALPAFRSTPRAVRDHADIPLVELASLARQFIDNGADEEEAVRRMAVAFELNRLRASTRERFEAAVKLGAVR